jgi:hypothetical protein
MTGIRYFFTGALLALLKFNLDRVLARQYGLHWEPWSYWVSPLPLNTLSSNPEGHPAMWTLLLASLPFLAAGVYYSYRRARTVNAPVPMVLLFFVPVLNIVMFLLLSLWPERPAATPIPRPTPAPRGLSINVTAAAVLCTTILGGLGVLLGTVQFQKYGFGLFVGLPFMLGFVSAYIYSFYEARRFAPAYGVTCLGLLAVGVLLLGVAIEGAVCLLMASPLALVLAAGGTALGLAARTPSRDDDLDYSFNRNVTLLVLAFPLLLGAEAQVKNPLCQVSTSIDIAAPAQAVWQQVVTFPPLDPPRELLFWSGISYPIGARIEGRGVGAVRYCQFNSGDFVEPITVWDEPHCLAFSVTSQPPPLTEWSPYQAIHPPHLDNFFQSERGQFLLQPLPEGGTRLVGTTWFRNHMAPAIYWDLWTDSIIHSIHRRVLVHIKKRAEKAAPAHG